MMLAAFLIGMALCGLTLVLIRAEGNAPGDKFASAVAVFSAWCALGMLIMGGTYGFGIVIPGVAAAVVLGVRTMNFGTRLDQLAPYKLPLGVSALVASGIVWLLVLNLFEEIPNG